ncbi:MAG: precorrin-6y C5,15-methyltransferase (decarboxylating) subunit CbiE [Dehalogenimonas sp.]
MIKPKVYIMGVGPGSSDWITPASLAAIEQSDWIIGWELDFKPLGKLPDGKRIIFQTCADYKQVIEKTALEAFSAHASVAILKTGDPLIAPAGLEELKRIFSKFDMRIIPGISTIQLTAAKVPVSLSDCQIFTYHPLPHDGGRDLRLKRKRMVSAFERGFNLLVLTGVRQSPKQTASFLIHAGIDNRTPCLVCQNPGQLQETITRCSLEKLTNLNFDWQSVLVVVNRKSPFKASACNP